MSNTTGGTSRGTGAATLAPAVRALAAGEMASFGAPFAKAGFNVAVPAPGLLQVRAAGRNEGRAAVLLSAGVHGDETAPIELLAQVLEGLGAQPEALAVDLMVAVGNLAAIAAGTRFVEADLNRLFRAERGDLAGVFETARADCLSAHSLAFFEAAGPRRFHLDLHTAIRPSRYPMFAIVPELLGAGARADLLAWLAAAGIGAVILNPRSAGTYSYFCAEHAGAAAATVELGQVAQLGQNDLSRFAATRAALDALVRAQQPAAGTAPQLFAIAQEIVKRSAGFALAFDRHTVNFSEMAQGAVIATDGGQVHTVRAARECVVFPNPDVRIGQRAALMVVPLA